MATIRIAWNRLKGLGCNIYIFLQSESEESYELETPYPECSYYSHILLFSLLGLLLAEENQCTIQGQSDAAKIP